MNGVMIFNPEHDLALANGDKNFIAPKNIREMARDLAPLLGVMDDEQLLVWGWDVAIKGQLKHKGIAEEQLPSDSSLAALRTCSERRSAHNLLDSFRADHSDGPYVGESFIIRNVDEIAFYANQYGHIVLKDPLSSSGKGLRHVNVYENEGGNSQRDAMSSSSLNKVKKWSDALVKRHGYLTAEPYYDKVQDFAMEFCVCDGLCSFIGYSLFRTNQHGRYEGNLLMEDTKIETLLSQYVPLADLHEVQAWIIRHSDRIIPTEWDTALHPLYFGIDMMVVRSPSIIRNPQFALHPCVEINLRLNMGIIAHEVRRKLLAPGAEGIFTVATFPTEGDALQFSKEQTKLFPILRSEGRVVSGYWPLTPVYPHTRYHAYVICE